MGITYERRGVGKSKLSAERREDFRGKGGEEKVNEGN